jgi:potassium efflux system protein
VKNRALYRGVYACLLAVTLFTGESRALAAADTTSKATTQTSQDNATKASSPAVTTEDKTKAAAEEAAPSPMHLDPNWWKYYTVDNKQMLQRIQKTEAALTEAIQSMPEEGRLDAEAQVKRIMVNLKALPQAREASVPPAVLPPFLNAYTLDQQLDLIALIRRLDVEVEEDAKEQYRQTESAKRMRQHIDSLMVSYLQMRDATLEKQEKGLEIMSLRMALGITEEQLRIVQARLDKRREELDHAQKARKIAQTSLTVPQVDVDKLDQNIMIAQENWKLAQNKSLKAEMAALGALGDTPAQRSRGFWLAQQAVNSQVDEALAHVDVIFQQIRRDLLLFIGMPANFDTTDLKASFRSWEEELKGIKAQLPEWEKKTDQEIARTMQPYVSGADSKEISDTSHLDSLQQKRYLQVQEALKSIKELQLRLSFSDSVFEQLRQRYLQNENLAVHGLYYLSSWIYTCCNPIIEWLQTPFFKIEGVPLTIFSLLRFFLIIGLAIALSSFLRRMINKINAGKTHLPAAYLYLINKLIHYGILLLGFFLAFTSIGLQLGNLAIVLGALTVGIGFGLQNIVNNLVSSLILLFSRTLKVGDYIELQDGKQGQVTAINIQNTVVHSKDGCDIIVPNSDLLSHRLTNWTLENSFKRLHIPFSVAYGNDREKVAEIVCAAAAKVPCTVMNSPHHSDPQVWLTRFGEALEFELVVWVNIYGFGHRGSMVSSYNWEIDAALRENNIVLSLPVREIVSFDKNANNLPVKPT